MLSWTFRELDRHIGVRVPAAGVRCARRRVGRELVKVLEQVTRRVVRRVAKQVVRRRQLRLVPQVPERCLIVQRVGRQEGSKRVCRLRAEQRGRRAHLRRRQSWLPLRAPSESRRDSRRLLDLSPSPASRLQSAKRLLHSARPSSPLPRARRPRCGEAIRGRSATGSSRRAFGANRLRTTANTSATTKVLIQLIDLFPVVDAMEVAPAKFANKHVARPRQRTNRLQTKILPESRRYKLSERFEHLAARKPQFGGEFRRIEPSVELYRGNQRQWRGRSAYSHLRIAQAVRSSQRRHQDRPRQSTALIATLERISSEQIRVQDMAIAVRTAQEFEVGARPRASRLHQPITDQRRLTTSTLPCIMRSRRRRCGCRA